MAYFVNQGRIAVAKSVKMRPLHVAWGAGLDEWDDMSRRVGFADLTATALVSEIGRRLVTDPRYAKPDPNGEILVHSGRYSVSPDPTNHLYIESTFDYTDSPGANVREVGVYVGCKTSPALPPGQLYFLPGDIVDPGDLAVLEVIPRIIHTETNRQLFRFVISF